MKKPQKNDILKLIAIISMVFDHVGFAFFPGQAIWRIIGRLAFPIFAYNLSLGYTYTSDLKKYFSRLLIFAFISQIPFSIFFGSATLNILFTFIFGLGLIHTLNKKRYFLSFLIIFFCAFVPLDFGLFGVTTIATFYFFRNKRALLLLNLFILIVFQTIINQTFITSFLFAGVLTALYFPRNIIQINLNKYIFYWFYPLHLIILTIIAVFVYLV